MGTVYYHGPDRHRFDPYCVDAQNRVSSPFFGIAPLGWVVAPGSDHIDRVRKWHDHAAVFDQALRAEISAPEIAADLDILRQAEVLDFNRSARIAERAAHLHWGEDLAQLSLWCLKEGQVASVWYARGHLKSGKVQSRAINVARDGVASRRLCASAKILEALPEALVAKCRERLEIDQVFCLVQDWVRDSREIGFGRTENGCALVAIERFLPDPDRPGALKGVVAESLSQVHFDAVVALIQAMLHAQNGGHQIPEIEIDRGDLVITPDGFRLVACSGHWLEISPDRSAAVQIIDYLTARSHAAPAYLMG